MVTIRPIWTAEYLVTRVRNYFLSGTSRQATLFGFFTPRRCGPASFRDGPREFTIQVAESAALVSVRHNHSHCLQPSSPSVWTTYPYPRSAPKVCRCSITLARFVVLPFPRSFLTLHLSAHPANRQTWRCRDVTCVFAGAASVAAAHCVRPLPHL